MSVYFMAIRDILQKFCIVNENLEYFVEFWIYVFPRFRVLYQE
jgi:hypothetical protein